MTKDEVTDYIFKELETEVNTDIKYYDSYVEFINNSPHIVIILYAYYNKPFINNIKHITTGQLGWCSKRLMSHKVLNSLKNIKLVSKDNTVKGNEIKYKFEFCLDINTSDSMLYLFLSDHNISNKLSELSKYLINNPAKKGYLYTPSLYYNPLIAIDTVFTQSGFKKRGAAQIYKYYNENGLVVQKYNYNFYGIEYDLTKVNGFKRIKNNLKKSDLQDLASNIAKYIKLLSNITFYNIGYTYNPSKITILNDLTSFTDFLIFLKNNNDILEKLAQRNPLEYYDIINKFNDIIEEINEEMNKDYGYYNDTESIASIDNIRQKLLQ